MVFGFRFLLPAVLVTLLSAPAAGQDPLDPRNFAQQVADVQTGVGRPPANIRYLLIVPRNQTPTDAVMLFAGGNGQLLLGYDGNFGTTLRDNFLVRSRFRFASHGLAVAVIETPNAQPIDGIVRLSADYALMMSKVVADIRTKTQAARVWLIGTSTGTMSAANIAARYPIQTIPVFPPPPPQNANFGRPNGVVLTSSQNKRVGSCGKVVQDADLSAINVPAYVVAHRDDACPCSDPGLTPNIVAALTGSPNRGMIEFTGGDLPQSGPCFALAPHGFFGIESAVVAAIAGWMSSSVPPRRPGL